MTKLTLNQAEILQFIADREGSEGPFVNIDNAGLPMQAASALDRRGLIAWTTKSGFLGQLGRVDRIARLTDEGREALKASYNNLSLNRERMGKGLPVRKASAAPSPAPEPKEYD